MRRQDWESHQIENSHHSKKIKESVRELLDEVWARGLELDEVKQVVETLSALVNGEAIVNEVPEPEYVWEEARPGALVVREWVRVKSDAYAGQAGMLHNGRQGPIIAIRSGDIMVRYEDDREPKLEFTRHSPHALEKRRAKR